MHTPYPAAAKSLIKENDLNLNASQIASPFTTGQCGQLVILTLLLFTSPAIPITPTTGICYVPSNSPKNFFSASSNDSTSYDGYFVSSLITFDVLVLRFTAFRQSLTFVPPTSPSKMTSSYTFLGLLIKYDAEIAANKAAVPVATAMPTYLESDDDYIIF
jgi:hypothetical protein